MPIQFLDVEDTDQAERVLSGRSTRNTDLWEEIVNEFTASGRRFARLDPASDERLLVPKADENGESTMVPRTASAVASALTSYADHRNLPVQARSYGDGTVLLATKEVEGEPVEPKRPGRKSKGQPAPEAE